MSSFLPEEARLSLARGARTVVGMGAFFFGEATGLPYPRFLGLHSAAEQAIDRGDLDEAEGLASDLLSLSEDFRKDWNHGNGVHQGHTLLGRIALRRRNIPQAVEHLLESAKTPGSPQLNSFGPSMVLAKELLAAGESESVITYFELCRSFWKAPGFTEARGRHPLDQWEEEVRAGDTPAFGFHLAF